MTMAIPLPRKSPQDLLERLLAEKAGKENQKTDGLALCRTLLICLHKRLRD